jgi:drug/metabolite transporter (DMT)-like permease
MAIHFLHHRFRFPDFDVTGVLVFSLLAAASYGLGAVLQHQAAGRESEELSMKAGLLVQLVKRPMWMVGNLLDFVGFFFQFLALRRGSLALVEPVLVLSLVFALPVAAALEHRRVTLVEIGSAGAMALGLGVFLAVGRPGAGSPHAKPLAWLLLTVGVAVGLGVLTLVARGGSKRRAALALAAGAGGAFGYVAALSERAGHQLDFGFWHTLASWTPYVLILAAIVALLMTQSAFQAGELRLSLPTLTLAQPLVAIAIGLAFFGEHLHTRGLRPVAEVAGIALMATGVVLLARPSVIGVHEEPAPPAGA